MYFLPNSLISFMPSPSIEPGILLAGVEAERNGAEQRPGRILADVVVRARYGPSRRCRSARRRAPAGRARSRRRRRPGSETCCRLLRRRIWRSVSQAPKSVSSDFGQLAVRRHLISGMDCAMAGAATADAAIPAPATLRNSRRFMGVFLLISRAPVLRDAMARLGEVETLGAAPGKFAVRLSSGNGARKGGRPATCCSFTVQRRRKAPSSDGCRRRPGTSRVAGKAISTVSPGSWAPESKSSAGSNIRTLWVRVSLLTIHSRPPRASATWPGWNVLSSCDTVLTCSAGAVGPLSTGTILSGSAGAASLVSVPRNAMRSARSASDSSSPRVEVLGQGRPVDRCR